jgi:hypothetical protein
METKNVALSKIMQGIQASYTQSYNRRHRKVGHLFPQWSLQNRPMVVMSKPANGSSPRPGCSTSLPPDQASPFWFANCVGRI